MNDEPTFRRFMKRVNALGPGACWEWILRKYYDPKLRGWFIETNIDFHGTFEGQAAHRVAYEFFWGPIPEGHILHHACLNGGCVNPTHLDAVLTTEHQSIHAWARRQQRLADEARQRQWDMDAVRGIPFTGETDD